MRGVAARAAGPSTGRAARVCQAPAGGVKLAPGEAGDERCGRSCCAFWTAGASARPARRTPSRWAPRRTSTASGRPARTRSSPRTGPTSACPRGRWATPRSATRTSAPAASSGWTCRASTTPSPTAASPPTPRSRDFIAALKESGGTAHLAGLASPGGVHAHQRQIAAAADGDRGRGRAGRDPRLPRRPRRAAEERARRRSPSSRRRCRDGRADRDGLRALLRHGPRQALGAGGAAVAAILHGEGEHAATAAEAIEAAYARGETDEFVTADGDRRLSRRRGRRRAVLRQLPRRPGAADPRRAGRPGLRRLRGGRAAEVGGGARHGAVLRRARRADAGDVPARRTSSTPSAPGWRARG